MDGVINVYKEKGMTSFDVVSKIKKIFKTKKVGHTGTLDPNATGVLPICIGNMTKLVQYITNHDKEYFAVVKLGIKTDTADITGNIIEENDIPKLTYEKIVDVTKEFIGKSMQLPPMYSAIKINGKKLYELAREGKEIEREARPIEIYDITDIVFSKEENTFSFRVKCSKGTYIRTLCEDICQKLGTIGTILELERISTGVFNKGNSHTLSQIENIVKDGDVTSLLYNVEDIFVEYPRLEIPEYKLQYYLNGVKLTYILENGIYKVYSEDRFIGLGEINDNLLKRKFVI